MRHNMSRSKDARARLEAVPLLGRISILEELAARELAAADREELGHPPQARADWEQEEALDLAATTHLPDSRISFPEA